MATKSKVVFASDAEAVRELRKAAARIGVLFEAGAARLADLEHAIAELDKAKKWADRLN